MVNQSRASIISIKLNQYIDVALFGYQRVSDILSGTDFTVTEPIDALGLNADLVHRSSPSGNRYLHRVLGSLDITPDDRIIDIGCAKGSALKCMSSFPFGRICGIELSSKLAERARSNLDKVRATRVEVVCGDALTFEFYHDFNVFYMYNPFPLAVAEAFFRRFSNVRDRNRENILIYNTPASSGVAASHGFELARSLPGKWGNPIHIYTDRPEASRLLRR
jgi:hypothetical protein